LTFHKLESVVAQISESPLAWVALRHSHGKDRQLTGLEIQSLPVKGFLKKTIGDHAKRLKDAEH
jgi:hypothetical protein